MALLGEGAMGDLAADDDDVVFDEAAWALAFRVRKGHSTPWEMQFRHDGCRSSHWWV